MSRFNLFESLLLPPPDTLLHLRNVPRFTWLIFLSSLMSAATLKTESVRAWDRYLAAAETNLDKHTQENATFLWLDESPDRRQRVRDGEIVVAETNAGVSKKAPNALIHDWTGAAFIRGARIDEVIAVLRDYGHYKEYYSPTVIRSHTVEQDALRDRFSVVLMNQSLIIKTAIETDCQATYHQLSDKRWYATSNATRVQEIDDFGHSGEHRLPVGEGGGYIWRLATITRFEERDGGVYFEVEALALSRDVPLSLRFIVDPIVRRVSRNSLIESLTQTERAVGESVAANLQAFGASR
jgi:hypothetical protein